MVHTLQALSEAWRVLKPHGVVCDIHPISVFLPIEVVKGNERIAAGFVDVINSPSDTLDRALITTGALTIARYEGRFSLEKETFFHVQHMWDSVEAFRTKFSKVLSKITFDEKFLSRLGSLLADMGPDAHVGTRRPVVIGRYRKLVRDD